jgi:hypothetical protein
VSQKVYHLRGRHVHRVRRSVKGTSIRDAFEDFGIPNVHQVCRTKIQDDWVQDVSELVLRYNQNLLIDTILILLQNGLLYNCQPFHNPTFVQCMELDCKVVYTNANQGIMCESHNIWAQDMQCEGNDLDNTFQGGIPSAPAFYFSWTPPNQIIQFQELLQAGNAISTISERCKKTQQRVLRPQAQDYTVVVPTNYKDLHGWSDCDDGFIRVVTQTNKMHLTPVGAIVRPTHIVRKNAASGGIDWAWHVINLLDVDNYCTVY